MSVYKQPKSKYWSYRFVWNNKEIRTSTKQTNRRVAEQMEAAKRTALAKGEVGLRTPKRAPTLSDFLDTDFLPFYRRTKGETEPNTVRDYEGGATNLKAFPPLARMRLEEINHDAVQAFIEHRQACRQKRRKNKPLEVSTINHDLRTLRRALRLAVDWGRVVAVVKFQLLPGENHRERALCQLEDGAYVKAASDFAYGLEQAYATALNGLRRRSEAATPEARCLSPPGHGSVDARCCVTAPESVAD